MEGFEQALPESEEAGSSSRKRSGSSNQEMPSKTSRAHATHGGRGAASASSTLAHPMPDGKLRVLEKEQIVAIEAQLTNLLAVVIPTRRAQERGRYPMDESARVRLAKQCLLDLMCGKVPSQEDWGFLFGDPLSTPGLAPSYIQNLKAWARNIAPDPRSKKKPMDQVKIQSLLAEAALNSDRYCLRYAHFPVFSTCTPLTPVSRCLSVFLPVHGPAPPRQ